METKPNNENLLGLVDKARQGKIVLPQFQRNFVWGRDDITDLLLSILEGYFIGSFLMLDTDADNTPFAVRAIQGVNKSPEELRPDWMVLDGQQRLTSLHYVFAAPPIPMRWTKYPYRFFLNLKKVAQGELGEAIWSDRADRVENWLDREKQYTELNVPFTILEDWDTWRDGYEDWLWERDDGSFAKYREDYRAAWTTIMRQLDSFVVPTIMIDKIPSDDPESIGQVCAIFEKMNSTGVRLSVYDLLTARLYKYGIDQHSLWEEAVETHELLNQFSDGKPDNYGVYALRTLALIRGMDAKSKTIINFSPENYADEWRSTVVYMERALKRLTATNEDGFGVFDPRWLPYTTMISPLAAMLHAIETKKLGHRAYKLMRRWYWASVFRERYAGAVESTIYRDYQDFLHAAKDPEFEPIAIADARVNIVENENYRLRDVSRVNSIYRGIMCLIAMKGAKDFQADDSIEFHTLEDHHIFPKAYLRKQKGSDGKKIPPNRINTIVNRTLISAQTNRRISRRSASDYLDKIIPAKRRTEILASHFIDEDGVNAMKSDNYNLFMDARELSLLAEMMNRLGD